VNRTTALPVADQLVQILADLRAAAGARARKAGPLGAVLGLVLVWLIRLFGRIDGIAARWHAGTLAAPKPRSIAAAPRQPRPAPPADAAPATPAQTLPRHFNWLADLLGAPADAAADRLRAVLADPELPTLIAAYPPAAPMLRRLCRALGVAIVPALRPRPRHPRPVLLPDPHPASGAVAPSPVPQPGMPAPSPQLWSHQPTDYEPPTHERISAALLRRRRHTLLYGI